MFVRLANGLLSLVENGVVNPLLASPDLAQNLPVSSDVTYLDLIWSSTSGVNFAINATSYDAKTLAPSTVASIFYSSDTGIVPTSDSHFFANFTCATDGTAVLESSFSLTGKSQIQSRNLQNPGNISEIYTLYFFKVCSSSAQITCDSCGPCYQAGSCDCMATDSGTYCPLRTTKITSAVSESKITVTPLGIYILISR
jgi:hypothetical protein